MNSVLNIIIRPNLLFIFAIYILILTNSYFLPYPYYFILPPATTPQSPVCPGNVAKTVAPKKPISRNTILKASLLNGEDKWVEYNFLSL